MYINGKDYKGTFFTAYDIKKEASFLLLIMQNHNWKKNCQFLTTVSIVRVTVVAAFKPKEKTEFITILAHMEFLFISTDTSVEKSCNMTVHDIGIALTLHQEASPGTAFPCCYLV